MLSISNPIRAGNGEYYLSLAATDDYYLKSDQEPAGFWLGSGAAALGLSGRIEPSAFRQLLRGFSPDGKTALVRNARGTAGRRAGWDATWSVPKSVSTAWSQAAPEIRVRIEEAVRRAVERAVAHTETLDIVTRSGPKGIHRDKARLIVAVWPHTLSRAAQPQLHHHCLILNVGVRANGSTGTLETKDLFRHKMLLGALFRVELAFQLEKELGLRSRIEGRSFELLGVPQELMDEFSTRRREILEELARLGQSGGKAAAIAALNTRTAKTAIARDELFAQWHHLGQQHHWTARHLSLLVEARFPPRDRKAEISALRQNSLLQLTNASSHFSARDLTVEVLQSAQGRGLSASEALAVARSLLHSPELVSVGMVGGQERFTTREIIELEREVVSLGRRMSATAPAITPLPCPAPSSEVPLSAEQKRALESITYPRRGGLSLLRGIAGAGKTTVFKAARAVWEEAGFQVLGAALSGKAAQELKRASGMECQTLHSLLWELEIGARHLGPHSVLVLDEAGMIGTRQLLSVLRACVQNGATCVLAGDDRQLQAIEHGGGFSALINHLPSVELTEIFRQKESWARNAVRLLAEGMPEPAMHAYEQRGLIRESRLEPEALARIIHDWTSRGGPQDPRSHVIMASTNAAVDDLNALAQQQRLQAGLLAPEFIELEGRRFFVGDRVLCTRNDRRLGVWNGDCATITSIRNNSLSLAVDGRPDPNQVEVNVTDYSDLTHSYALTIHRAQGTTLQHALVLASRQNREIAYVEASRARESTTWFTTEPLKTVTEQMTVSKKKEFVTELVPTLEP